MAVISKLRNSKWVVIVVLVSLALFVISDYFSNQSKFSLKEQTVGEIDGKSISYAEFDGRYKMNLENYGGRGYTDEQILNVTWDQFLTERLLEEEFKANGIDISTKEMEELLMTEKAHAITKQNFTGEDGVFNPANVKTFLKNAKSNPKAMEGFEVMYNQIKSTVKSERFLSLVKNTFYATTLDAEDQYYSSQANINGQSVSVNYSSIDDKTIKYTDEDLKEYINKHKEDFKQKAARNLSYVLFDVRPSIEDTLAIKKEVELLATDFKTTDNDSLFVSVNSSVAFDTTFHPRGHFNASYENKLFNAPKDSVIGPIAYEGGFSLFKVTKTKNDSVAYYHLIRAEIPVPGTTKADTADAIAKGKKIIAEGASSSNFLDFLQGKTRTGELSTAEDMRWNRMGTPGLDQIEKAVKTMSVGQAQVIKNVYGLSIIKLVDPKSYTNIQVAEVRKMVEPLKTTIETVYQKASSFSGSLTEKSPEAFESVCKKFNIAKSVANDVKEADKNFSGLPGTRELVRWAYNEETNVNDYSGVVDCGSFYVIAQLNKIKQEGTADLEDVKEQVIRLVVNEKKAAIIKADFEKAMKGSTDLNQIANALKTIVQPFNNVNMNAGGIPYAGNDPIIIGYICGMKANELSKPVVSKDGVHIFKVDRIEKPAAPQSFDRDKEMMYGDQRGQVYASVFEGLKVAKKVIDERSKYY